MSKEPWSDPDPQPGDFDVDVLAMSPCDIQTVEPGSGGRITIVVNVQGDDAIRLQRLADERGKRIDEVVADVLRDLMPHAA